MSDLRKDLPSAKADNFPQRTREVLMTYMGRQGNPLDRGLTLRDLIENGLAEFPQGYTPRPGGGTPPLVPGPSIPSPEVDLTPPPTPTGFSVDAAISHIFIEHDAPTYRQGHGHLRTRVYGATWTSGDLPVFADAIEITQFSGTTFAHPTNPSTTWHLWIKWETKDGVLSADPAGGANGLVAITGQNVGLLLDALDGELNESQLTQGLRSRIELIDGPSSTPGTVAQRVLAEQTARSTADDALSSSISTLGTTVNNNYNTLNSAIQAETSARSTAISTEANARQTLQSRVESIDSTLTAAVQTEASTRASETGSLFAKYTIKVDVNGYVSGFGLASTSNNGVPTSEFTIVADKFSIAPVQTDNTANDGSPFFHRTTATTINGVSVPAGTYMKAAYIHDATITNAKIADLAVDNAKIANLSASKLTAGSISVGQHIQSSGFVSGTSGWRINGDGTAEFANAIVRGTVYANAGSFTGSIYASSGAIGGVNINGGGLNAGGFTGYAWPTSGQNGFHLGPGGLAMGNPDNGKYFNVTADGNVFAPGLSIVGGAATFSGSLSAATGTFKGSLQAASGSFSGTLTADAINAVSTINIADNAVSVVVSAGGTGSEVATTINVPQGQTWKVVVIGFVSSSPEFEYGTSAGNPTTRPPLATIGVNGASSFLSPIRVRDVLTSSNETGDGYSHYWVYQSSSVSNVLTLTQGTHTLSVTGPSSTFKAIVALGAKK
jgi:hypothetical protein